MQKVTDEQKLKSMTIKDLFDIRYQAQMYVKSGYSNIEAIKLAKRKLGIDNTIHSL